MRLIVLAPFHLSPYRQVVMTHKYISSSAQASFRRVFVHRGGTGCKGSFPGTCLIFLRLTICSPDPLFMRLAFGRLDRSLSLLEDGSES